MSPIDYEVQLVNPDALRHLTQLVADISQDRQDLLDYVAKLEIKQQLHLTEMKLLQKSNAELAHQNNLYHLSYST